MPSGAFAFVRAALFGGAVWATWVHESPANACGPKPQQLPLLRIEHTGEVCPTISFSVTHLDERGHPPGIGPGQLRVRVDEVELPDAPAVTSYQAQGKGACLVVAVQTNDPLDDALPIVQDGLRRILQSVAPSSKVGFLEFSKLVHNELALGDSTQAGDWVEQLAPRDEPETNLLDACSKAVALAESCPPELHPRAVVLIASGISSAWEGQKSKFANCAIGAGRENIAFHTVRFRPNDGPDFPALTTLSDKTGGERRCAHDRNELKAALESVAHQLSALRTVEVRADERLFDGKQHELELTGPGVAPPRKKLELRRCIEQPPRWEVWIAIPAALAVLGLAGWLTYRFAILRKPPVLAAAPPQPPPGPGGGTVHIPHPAPPPRPARPPPPITGADGPKRPGEQPPPIVSPSEDRHASANPPGELMERWKNAAGQQGRPPPEPPRIRREPTGIAQFGGLRNMAPACLVTTGSEGLRTIGVSPGQPSEIAGVTFRCEDGQHWSMEQDGTKVLLQDGQTFQAGGGRYVFVVGRATRHDATPGPRLEVLGGPDSGRSLPLVEGRSLTIGSSPAADYLVRGDGISAIHAAASWDGSRCEIVRLDGDALDQGSGGNGLPWLKIAVGERVVLAGSTEDPDRLVAVELKPL